MNASRLRTVYLLLLFVLVGVTAAAPLTRIEYAIDPPDLNNNWVIGSPLNSDSATGTLNIPLSGLSNGLHVLLTRVVDSNNRKSIPVVRNLWVVRNNSTVVPYGEYFIDFDPGPTHGSEIIFRESDSVSVSFAVPVATQSPGFHVLGIRVNDRAGNWSLPTTRPLWIEHLPSTTVSGAEWFLDTDPGAGAANTVIVTPADSVGMQFIASLPNVGPGMHVFGFRVRAQNNKWSLPVYRPFWLEQLTSQNITRVEYSFDTLASPGFGTPLPIITGDSVGASVTVPLTSLSYGFHQVWIRVKDQSEKWSHPISRCFWNGNYNLSTPNITRAEYFLDNDPGIGSAISVAIANADSVHANFLISLTGVSLGNHSLFMRVRDENGKWSQPAFSGFVVAQPPGSPSLLTIQYLNPGALLSWTPPENQVAGYRIYRSVNGYFNPPETGSLVGSVSGTTTTFTDMGVTGRCFYRVTAIDGLATSQRREPPTIFTPK